MKRVLIRVEGQTEERFVKEVLRPHLWERKVDVVPTLVVTKRVKRGPQFKGGINSFEQVRRDVPKLLGDTTAVLITTMFDLYRLPDDFPGMVDVGNKKGRLKAEHVERALNEHFASRRFVAFLMVHEFEALAFADPAVTCRVLSVPGKTAAIQLERDRFRSAEDVNDGADTHPSKRISNHFDHYQEPLHGPPIVQEIGLSKIRAECPHFAEWLARLESL